MKKEEPKKTPVRINKYLANQGVATRRAVDELIEGGKVFINGKKAVLGDKVNEGDKVETKGRTKQDLKYFAFYKPKGIVTHSPTEGEREIKDMAPKDTFPIGRLDKNSEGLIILTNDGRITDRILSPKYEHEKEYLVGVREPVTAAFLRAMEGGVNIEGYKTKKTKTKRIDDHIFSIILIEGKRHQIRRMCMALGNPVTTLKRVRVMTIEIKTLKEGQARPLVGEEKEVFLKSLELE